MGEQAAAAKKSGSIGVVGAIALLVLGGLIVVSVFGRR